MTAPTTVKAKVLMALAERTGTYTSARELSCIVYSDRADGGPDWAVACVTVNIHEIRKSLKGAEIIHVTGRGYQLISGALQ